jgi:uncharacterized protein YbbC (DUF1343 family)
VTIAASARAARTNIRSVTQALLYSGIGLLEATNLSVGRGTDTPFEVVGAPWIEPTGLAQALNGLRLPGIRVEPIWFTPAASVYARVAGACASSSPIGTPCAR